MLEDKKNKIRELLNKAGQQKIALVLGYILVALLFFNLGKLNQQTIPPEVVVQEPEIDPAKLDFTSNSAAKQEQAEKAAVLGETDQDCNGLIKGNISSSGKIYHLPGGSFYNRTNPEICFQSEAEAVHAGFRKSKR